MVDNRIGASPKLRFVEFVDEWKVSKLGSVARISSGGTPARTNPEYWSGIIPWVTTSEIDFNTITDTKQHITSLGMKKSAAKLFPKGSVLIALYGQGKTRGKVAILGIEATTNQACAAIIPDNSKLDYLFLFQNLSARYDELRELSNDGSQKNLNGQLMKSLNLTTPPMREQQKIVDFLTTVDEKIAYIDKRLYLLRQYKKGVMQKIFTQEIRFKDDRGRPYPTWKETRLKDIMTESRIKGSRGDVARKITVKLWGKGVFEKNEAIAGSVNTHYFKRKAGQLIYSKLDFLNCAFGIIPEELDGFESTVDLPAFDIKDEYNGNFLIERILQKNFYERLGETADGSRKARRIHANIFLSFSIKIPVLEEQKKIADFLKVIDYRINIEQTKLERVKKFKSSLLQKMFI
jgi:type I restriction enzyme S subunit